jgi:hypothetical protein
MATENDWIVTNLEDRRFNPAVQFYVTLYPYYFDEMSFNEAADFTARKIYSKHKNLFLSFSGGADSDFVFHCLVRNNIPFTPIIVKTGGNMKELAYAFKTCEKFDIKPHIIDLTDAEFLKIYYNKIVKQINGRGVWAVPSIVACEYARDNDGVLLIGEHMLDTVKEKESSRITPAMNEWDFYNEVLVGDNFNIPFFNYTVELFYAMVNAIRDDVSLTKFKAELYGFEERPIMSYEFPPEFHTMIKSINFGSRNSPTETQAHWSFKGKEKLLELLNLWKRPKTNTYKSLTTLPQLHLGYYVFNNQIYIDRRKILDEMIASKYSWGSNKVEFVFNDDVFGHVDWTINPQFSLKTLYKERAQQLRDSYDYLILSYSGGADSHEILYTFLEHNIHIDEIQVVHFEKALERINNNLVMEDSVLQLLKEYEYAALPNIKYVTDNFPHIKINTIDASDFLLEDAASGKFEFMGYQDKKSNSTFLGVVSGYVRPYFQHHYNNKNFDPKGKTAFIRGVDKPILGIRDNRMMFKFSDVSMHTLNMIESGDIGNIYTLENFFWSRNAPLIPVKQAHVIKEVLEKDIQFYARFMANQQSTVSSMSSGTKPNPGSDSNFQRHYCQYIYYHWSPTIFAAPKTRESPDFKLINLVSDKNFAYEAAKENNQWFTERYKYIENKALISRHIQTKEYDVGEFKPQWS